MGEVALSGGCKDASARRQSELEARLQELQALLDKLSFGTQSARGSPFLEMMLTVIETCRQQRRNTFAFVAAAVAALCAGRPAASLLSGV